MGWRTPSVETVKIEDENPLTWLGSAVKLSQEGRISQALEYLEKARRYGRNNQDITIRCDMIETVIHYDQGDVSVARSSINRNDDTVRKMVMDNITLLTAYLHYDYSYWESIWKELLVRHLNDWDVSFFEDNAEYIHGRLLAEIASDEFVKKVMKAESVQLMKSLIAGNYPLSAYRDKDFKILDCRPEPNLLMLAVSKGNMELTQVLASHNVNQINATDGIGQNALWYVSLARKNCKELIDYLCREGIDRHHTDEDGTSAVFMAVAMGNKDVLEYLIQKGVPVETYNAIMSPLAAACIGDTQNYEMAKILIKNGADVNTRIAEDNNRTILHEIAARRHWDSGNRKIWELLLESGASVDLQDSNGYTPLMLSIDHDWFFSAEVDMANELHRRGASLTKKAYDGRSALSISKEKDLEWN